MLIDIRPALKSISACQKNLLKIIQKALPHFSRTYQLKVSIQQTFSFRLIQLRLDRVNSQSRALGKQIGIKAIDQPQRIEHEFKPQFVSFYLRLFKHRIARTSMLEIGFRLLVASLSD